MSQANNRIGISSACYYPQLTEDSFRKVCESGADTAELFFNSPSELEKPFLRELLCMKEYYGIQVPSVHPFASFTESYYLFSNYERRYDDFLPLYQHFFEAMAMLDAHIFVLHGSKKSGSVSEERYFELFARLLETAKPFGVTVAQENVVDYRSESPQLLLRMKKAVGSGFRTVFDIKQARRAGVDPFAFLDCLWDTVCHVHLSDYNDKSDCVPPGEGQFDFARLFCFLQNKGYAGAYVEELYSHSYREERQITDGWRHLQKVYTDCTLSGKK